MSIHDFSTAEFQERRARASAAVRAAGLDWMLLFHPVSIRWLTGSDAKSYQEFQCLFIAADSEAVEVLTRDGERNEFLADAFAVSVNSWGGGEPDDPIVALEPIAARYVKRFGSRIGIEVPGYYLHPHHYVRIRQLFVEQSIVEASNLILDLTLVKSATELRYIREAARIADIGMQRFVTSLLAGRSELEIAGEVYHALLTSGSGLAASPINLVSGERAGFSHGAPTERRLQARDQGNVEFGATYKRYTSTIGRDFCLGQPGARLRELNLLVRRASDACMAEIRDGVPAVVPHEAAKRVIADAGLNHGRVHTTGYGLAPGFPPTWGEPIHMFGGSTYTLRAGMVVTVEPPVFLDEGAAHFGVRIIDNVLVTNTGCELLSRFSRDLIVVE